MIGPAGFMAAPKQREPEPECGMCNDSGIVGFPPDQYEDCPDCIKSRTVAQEATEQKGGD